MVLVPLGLSTCVSPSLPTVESSYRLCWCEEMITQRIFYRWLIMTLRFLVVDVFLAGVFDVLILCPIEACLGMGEADNVEGMGGTRDAGAMGDMGGPLREDGGSA